jgi:hypothetical protein
LQIDNNWHRKIKKGCGAVAINHKIKLLNYKLRFQ